MSDLSHHEGHVLALICKWQPTTAYFVRKTLERGPATTFSSSPGSIYPVIEKLKRKGLIVAAPVEGDGRRTEQIECSSAGEMAVRAWICRIEPSDLLPEDPWRTRMVFSDLLSPQQQLDWLVTMRAAARDLANNLAIQARIEVDASAIRAHENAKMLTDARLAWIERMISGAVAEE